jgi:ParB-like chromosome segregation protein Spo0J
MRHTLQVERVSLDDLRPHPRNPRNGDTDAIVASLQVNGQYRPIVVAHGGTILAGNHTYAAAAELGWKHIDIVRLDVDPESEDAYRIMLADNRTGDLGRYDDALLLDLLREVDLAGTAYTEEDLTVLAAHLAASEAAPLDSQEFQDVSDGGYVTLTIHNLTNGEVGTFRGLPGPTDTDRLRYLLETVNG